MLLLGSSKPARAWRNGAVSGHVTVYKNYLNRLSAKRGNLAQNLDTKIPYFVPHPGHCANVILTRGQAAQAPDEQMVLNSPKPEYGMIVIEMKFTRVIICAVVTLSLRSRHS